VEPGRPRLEGSTPSPLRRAESAALAGNPATAARAGHTNLGRRRQSDFAALACSFAVALSGAPTTAALAVALAAVAHDELSQGRR
jgi:hypothetical protein